MSNKYGDDSQMKMGRIQPKAKDMHGCTPQLLCWHEGIGIEVRVKEILMKVLAS